jgi:hypothetical protein
LEHGVKTWLPRPVENWLLDLILHAKTFSLDDIVLQLLKNPQRGHCARLESSDLTDVLRVALPKFQIFAVFYRWDGKTLTVITLEHTAQDLPARLAAVLSTPVGEGPGNHKKRIAN